MHTLSSSHLHTYLHSSLDNPHLPLPCYTHYTPSHNTPSHNTPSHTSPYYATHCTCCLTKHPLTCNSLPHIPSHNTLPHTHTPSHSRSLTHHTPSHSRSLTPTLPHTHTDTPSHSCSLTPHTHTPSHPPSHMHTLTELPYNDYFEYFGPDFKLHISPTNMSNQNTPEYLNKIKWVECEGVCCVRVCSVCLLYGSVSVLLRKFSGGASGLHIAKWAFFVGGEQMPLPE